MQLSVEGDMKAITKDLDKIQRKLVPAVSSQSLNAVPSGKTGVITRSVKAIAAATGISQKHIRARYGTSDGSRKAARIQVMKRDKAKVRKQYVKITDYFHAGISAMHLGAKDTRGMKRGKNKGTGVRLTKGPQKHFGSAWIAKGKASGKTLAFSRRPFGHHPATGKKGGTGPVEVRVDIQRVARTIIEKVIARSGRKRFISEFDKRMKKKLRSKGLLNVSR